MSLDAYRRDIDAIDDQIHDLIMRRAAVSTAIAEVKGDTAGPVYQPAREATILRRLMSRHAGPLPRASVVRLWREIVGASACLQADLSVAVYFDMRDEGGGLDFWAVARDHFAGGIPLIAFDNAQQVLNAVSTGAVSIGVLPMPREDERHPWWSKLLGEGAQVPRVVARLPIIAPTGKGRPEALVAALGADLAGSDRVLVALECETQTSRSGVQDGLLKAGLKPTLCVAWDDDSRDGTRLHLAEVSGQEPIDAVRLGLISQRAGTAVRSVVQVGGYVAPLADGP